MDWLLIVVIVLAALWGFLWHRTRQQAADEPPTLQDPQRERARDLLTEAATAETEGRWADAQRMRLRATWLRAEPPTGQDMPPSTLNPNDLAHLRWADAIRQRYAAALSDKDHPHADCTFQPAARLPFPREDVARTLDLLIGIGHGDVMSAHVDRDALSADELIVVERSRQVLETFVDVPPEDLPTDPDENLEYGQRLRSDR